MRYLGTLMVLACVAMLLFPGFWEARRQAGTAVEREVLPGRSTLTGEDLLPPWRGPARRGGEDG